MDYKTVVASMLEKDEGFKQHIYSLNGVRHIGFGFNLDDVGLYREEAEFILANRISICEEELKRVLTWYEGLSDIRKTVLINLCYNIGLPRLLQFREFIENSALGEWELASRELLDSKAHMQNHQRIERLAYCWEMDKI